MEKLPSNLVEGEKNNNTHTQTHSHTHTQSRAYGCTDQPTHTQSANYLDDQSGKCYRLEHSTDSSCNHPSSLPTKPILALYSAARVGRTITRLVLIMYNIDDTHSKSETSTRWYYNYIHLWPHPYNGQYYYAYPGLGKSRPSLAERKHYFFFSTKNSINLSGLIDEQITQ